MITDLNKGFITAILAQAAAYGLSSHYVVSCFPFGCFHESQVGHI